MTGRAAGQALKRGAKRAKAKVGERVAYKKPNTPLETFLPKDEFRGTIPGSSRMGTGEAQPDYKRLDTAQRLDQCASGSALSLQSERVIDVSRLQSSTS